MRKKIGGDNRSCVNKKFIYIYIYTVRLRVDSLQKVYFLKKLCIVAYLLQKGDKMEH